MGAIIRIKNLILNYLNEIKEVNLYRVFVLLIERLYNRFIKMILEKTNRIY